MSVILAALILLIILIIFHSFGLFDCDYGRERLTASVRQKLPPRRKFPIRRVSVATNIPAKLPIPSSTEILYRNLGRIHVEVYFFMYTFNYNKFNINANPVIDSIGADNFNLIRKDFAELETIMFAEFIGGIHGKIIPHDYQMTETRKCIKLATSMLDKVGNFPDKNKNADIFAFVLTIYLKMVELLVDLIKKSASVDEYVQRMYVLIATQFQMIIPLFKSMIADDNPHRHMIFYRLDNMIIGKNNITLNNYEINASLLYFEFKQIKLTSGLMYPTIQLLINTAINLVSINQDYNGYKTITL
jgi:hypothetical protein